MFNHRRAFAGFVGIAALGVCSQGCGAEALVPSDGGSSALPDGGGGESGTYHAFTPTTKAWGLSYSPSGSFVGRDVAATPVTVGGVALYPPGFGATLAATDAEMQALVIPAGNNYAYAESVNNLGVIAGVYGVASVGATGLVYTAIPCYWSSATAAPIALALPAGEQNEIRLEAISKSGAIWGHTALGAGTGTSYGALYVWATPASNPVALRPYSAKNLYFAGSFSDGGRLVVQGTDQGALLYEPPYTAPPIVLLAPDGAADRPFRIGPDGTFFGTDAAGMGFYAPGSDYTHGIYLPGGDVIEAMNSLGQACGHSPPLSYEYGVALFWTSGAATPARIPGNAITATALYDDGTMYLTDQYGNHSWVRRTP
jgi:hypothetical protein